MVAMDVTMRPAADFVLMIDGMMCQKNCAATVQQAIKSVKNVDDAIVTFGVNRAQIWGKGIELESVINAIENTGYGAALVTTDHNQNMAHNSDPADIIINIENMYDPLKCPMKINSILLTVAGVISSKVEYNQKKTFIWGFADIESILVALENAGYTCTNAADASDTGDSGAPHAVVAESGHGPAEVVFSLELLSKISGGLEKAEASLAAIAGVESVRVDREGGAVRMHYDTSRTSTLAVRNAITDLHFAPAITDSTPALDLLTNARRELLFDVSGMSCASCALKVERFLCRQTGVVECGVSSVTNRARVVLDERVGRGVGPRDLVEGVQALGYGCALVDEEDRADGRRSDGEFLMWRRLMALSLVLGLPVMCLHLSMAVSPRAMDMALRPAACGHAINLGQLLMLCLNAPILVLVGFKYYRAALLGALHGNYGMDCLVTIGTVVTFAYSCAQVGMACSSGGAPAQHVFFEATGMLLMFVTVGKFIEAYAKGRSMSAVTDLLKLQPREALLVVPSATAVPTSSSAAGGQPPPPPSSEVLKTIALDLVQRGDLLKVLPGSSIPTDGCVESGASFVDQSMITGESVAVLKERGDLVFGSTVNQNGCLYVRVSSLGSESALAQIVRLVEAAQMSKAPVQAYADRVASVFTPLILVMAATTFLTWYSLSVSHVVPRDWFAQQYDDPLLFSLLFAISVVVISCPCALGLATPTAIMVGTAVGAANGILIKGGSAFEMAYRINTVVFDKTGTLTAGRPTVTDQLVLREQDLRAKVLPRLRFVDDRVPASSSTQQTSDCLLWLAATAEQMSEHPLARAVLQAAENRRFSLEPVAEGAASSFVGNGVAFESSIGKVLVGNRGFLEQQDVAVGSGLDTALWDLEVQGKTAVCVALDGTVLGILGVADVAKPDAQTAVRALRGLGVDVWMLTGDSRTTAEALADQLDIPKERVLAGVLPRDKAEKVEELQSRGQFVAMVGDGINDSPALARADLGVAIGTGTQVAMEAADMVLIRGDLHDLVVALDLAKVVFRRIQYNFMWAFIYNVAAVPYAAGVWFPWTHMLLPPQYAGLAMALSSISVVLSSMALRLYRRPSYLDGDSGGAEGSMLQTAKRKIANLKEKVIRVSSAQLGGSGGRTGSGAQYQQLARDEQEADQSLGLELGIGGIGGILGGGGRDSQRLLGGHEDDDCDDIV